MTFYSRSLEYSRVRQLRSELPVVSFKPASYHSSQCMHAVSSTQRKKIRCHSQLFCNFRSQPYQGSHRLENVAKNFCIKEWVYVIYFGTQGNVTTLFFCQVVTVIHSGRVILFLLSLFLVYTPVYFLKYQISGIIVCFDF